MKPTSNQQHTRGPWKVSAIFPDKQRGHTFEPHVSVCGKYEGKDIRLADIPDVADEQSEEYTNARLIAAAPDLLSDCEAALAYIVDDSRSARRREAMIESLIRSIAKAKAEGHNA